MVLVHLSCLYYVQHCHIVTLNHFHQNQFVLLHNCFYFVCLKLYWLLDQVINCWIMPLICHGWWNMYILLNTIKNELWILYGAYNFCIDMYYIRDLQFFSFLDLLAWWFGGESKNCFFLRFLGFSSSSISVVLVLQKSDILFFDCAYDSDKKKLFTLYCEF